MLLETLAVLFGPAARSCHSSDTEGLGLVLAEGWLLATVLALVLASSDLALGWMS